MANGQTKTQYPDWLNATLASDATEGRGVMPGWVQALKPDSRVVGPAFVVLASQDDNLALVRAMSEPAVSGCVLVVGGQSSSRTATIGDLMALEMLNLGVLGLVTDGLVRDSQEIRQLGLPVWCRGVTPTASAKRNQGVIGGAVSIGGAMVRAGDLIIADADGVVIWPQEEIETLLARAQTKLDADNVRLERLRQASRNST